MADTDGKGDGPGKLGCDDHGDWCGYQELARRIVLLAIADTVKTVCKSAGEYPTGPFRRLYPMCNGDLQDVEVRHFFHSDQCELYLAVAGWDGMDGRTMHYLIKRRKRIRGRIARNMHELRAG